MKTAEEWTVSLNSELCTIPSHRTRSDPEAIRATIIAVQADVLRHAAELVDEARSGEIDSDLRSIRDRIKAAANTLLTTT